MADVTISSLPPGTPLETDVLPYSNGTTTSKVQIQSLPVSWNSITNKPTIPTQVNADWNATSGVAQILNKPTIPVVNNLQLAKAWVSFNGTTGSTVGSEFRCTINNQYNVSKVVRTASGRFDIYFTSPMPSAGYAAVGSPGGGSSANFLKVTAQSASVTSIWTFDVGGSGYPGINPPICGLTVFSN